jgi:RNase P subunit RPR2
VSDLAWGKHPPSAIPVDGRREIGDRCPNCDYPTDLPVQGVFPVVAESTPSSPTWTCTHCGWTMTAPHHEERHDNRSPGVPFPSGPYGLT